MVARRQGECNFHEVAVQFTPAAIGVTGYRRARKEGRKERGDRKGEREREREAGARARAKEDRERKREGKRRRWSAYTETHVRTRGAAALSSVPSAPSDVGQCSRLRRSRELVPIKARVPGLRSRPRRG